MKIGDHVVARTVAGAAVLLGGGSLLLLVVFLFIGSLQFVNARWGDAASLLWDGAISITFFVQHSGMIRKGYRERLSATIPSYYGDAVFAICSGAVLALVIILWQPTRATAYELQGAARWSARLVFFLALAGMNWGSGALKSFDPFGRQAIRSRLAAETAPGKTFRVQGPYLWVRHPLYFFTLLLIWSCPDVGLDRLLFNILWTIWIFLGARLEEKDLASAFGEPYRRYQRKVPMLIPWKGRRTISDGRSHA